jgi:hypothetical protein
MPTWGRPDLAAARARATANVRPALIGIDSRTTVKPFRAGQGVKAPAPGARGAVVAGGGVVGAGGVVAVGVPAKPIKANPRMPNEVGE